MAAQQQLAQQIIDGLLGITVSLVLAIAGFAATRLLNWLGIKKDASVRAAFDDVLEKSVLYGLQQSRDLIRERGWDDDLVRSSAIDHALPYVRRFPDVLKTLNINLSDKAVLEGWLRDALDRSFPKAVDIAARSPGTPPSTAPVPERQADLPGLVMATPCVSCGR